jgi:hypothetical protein
MKAKHTWTAAEVFELGVRTDIETAGSILGLSRTQAYEAVKAGRFPVPVIPIGRRRIVAVAPLLTLLGMTSDAGVLHDERPDLAVVRDHSARPGEAA